MEITRKFLFMPKNFTSFGAKMREINRSRALKSVVEKVPPTK